MRVEANISVTKDKAVYGTKCEVKNLNSFASVESAIKCEVERHIGLIEEGKKVAQETRGWDEVKQETFSQRKKENAHDYRYFPDPDLPKLYLSKLFDKEELRSLLPELPDAKRKRLSALGLKEETVLMLVESLTLSSYFDTVTEGKEGEFITLATNYLIADVLGILKKEGRDITHDNLPKASEYVILIDMLLAGELSSRAAKDLLPLLLQDKTLTVRTLAEEKGLIQKNDMSALEAIVDAVLTKSETQVTDYKAGKESMFMYFVGQCMKESKGAGNPKLFQEILKKKLA